MQTMNNHSVWPSSYYGKTRRIDLEQFYKEIMKASPKRVTFSPDPPVVYEYEPEYDTEITPHVSSYRLMDDGWPGRAKKAMDSTEYKDFTSKIEAKLSAINDPSLMVELHKVGYRHRKSPLVQKLDLRPIPNPIMPNLVLDTPSPSSSSYTDSPLTPRDIPALPILSVSSSSSSTASSSLISPNGSIRWFKSLTRMKSVSLKSKTVS